MEDQGLSCSLCGLDNLTTSCGVSDCGLVYPVNGDDPIADVVAEVKSKALSLYGRTGDIKDINAYVVPLSTLKALYAAAGLE